MCGTTIVNRPGISSFKLNGTMTTEVRRIDTGFFTIQKNPENFDTEIIEPFNYFVTK